jgi:hypothetical protein
MHGSSASWDMIAYLYVDVKHFQELILYAIFRLRYVRKPREPIF